MIVEEGEYNQRKVWDQIADQWSDFRHYPIKQVKEFSMIVTKEVPKLSDINASLKKKVLDIGAGNGRNLLPFKDHDLYALDLSKEMLMNTIKYSKKFDLDIKPIQGSAVDLPIKNETFDVVIATASLQCIPKKKERENAINEIYRILKPNGLVLISSWNKWNFRFFPRNLISSDIYVPWHRQTESIDRYYHLFSKRELVKLIESSGLKIEKFIDTSLFSDNIYVVARKSL